MQSELIVLNLRWSQEIRRAEEIVQFLSANIDNFLNGLFDGF